MIKFSVLTIFPELIDSYTSRSILKRAQENGLVTIKSYNLRDWTTDKHHTVDDKVFGGGAGMLLKIQPLFDAINDLKKQSIKNGFTPVVIATSAAGELFSSKMASSFAKGAENKDINYIIICGRYEGFDARVNEFIDIFITTGPYILTGGELSALIMVDAITRLVPGVLGNPKSSMEETSFELVNNKIHTNKEHPQYSLPSTFEGEDYQGIKHTLSVPSILLSGHHKNIDEYNKSQREDKIENIE